MKILPVVQRDENATWEIISTHYVVGGVVLAQTNRISWRHKRPYFFNQDSSLFSFSDPF